MSEFSIRPATPADYDAIGRLCVAAYVDAGFVPAASDYAPVLADSATRAREATLLAAVDAVGTIIGTVTFCRPGSSYAELPQPGEAEFRMLAVSSEARGRGIGEALVRECLGRARAHGDDAIVLSTQTAMRAAHRIYERLGFVRVPERDWYPVPHVRLLCYRLAL